MARTVGPTMWELRKGCREAVTWAVRRLPIPPLLPELEQVQGGQMLEKAVPRRHLGEQEKQQAL